MGTSSSSKGPGSGVPMVPPWADDMPTSSDNEGDGKTNSGDADEQSPAADQNTNPSTENPPLSPPSPIASLGRFTGARASMRAFAGSGNSDDMRKGVGRYVSKGYGGSKTASKRLGGTVSTAAALSGMLSSDSRGSSDSSPIDVQALKGKSASEVMDAVVEAVRPIDGTQDTEASRESIKDALSELLEQHPTADLLELDGNEKLFVVEHFIASDVYRRIFLDIGKTIQEKSPSAMAGLKRLRQIKDYVRETVKSSFKHKGVVKSSISPKEVASMAKSVLLETFEVFEGYAQ